MPLDQEQQNKVNSWMTQKGVNPSCPACRRMGQWSLGDIIVSPPMEGGNINFSGSLIPMVQLICNNCGFIMLFGAAPMGILKEGDIKKS